MLHERVVDLLFNLSSFINFWANRVLSAAHFFDFSGMMWTNLAL